MTMAGEATRTGIESNISSFFSGPFFLYHWLGKVNERLVTPSTRMRPRSAVRRNRNTRFDPSSALLVYFRVSYYAILVSLEIGLRGSSLAAVPISPDYLSSAPSPARADNALCVDYTIESNYAIARLA